MRKFIAISCLLALLTVAVVPQAFAQEEEGPSLWPAWITWIVEATVELSSLISPHKAVSAESDGDTGKNPPTDPPTPNSPTAQTQDAEAEYGPLIVPNG